MRQDEKQMQICYGFKWQLRMKILAFNNLVLPVALVTCFNYLKMSSIITTHNGSCRKVIFSQVSVILWAGGGGGAR